MKDLNELENTCIDLLSQGSFFQLDTGEQSFNVFPTEHINLINDYYSINIGHIIYGNITTYDEIMEDLQSIYDCCQEAQDRISDFVQIIYLQDESKPFRVVFGGLGEQDQESFDFEEVTDLLAKLKTFEFNS